MDCAVTSQGTITPSDYTKVVTVTNIENGYLVAWSGYDTETGQYRTRQIFANDFVDIARAVEELLG